MKISLFMTVFMLSWQFNHAIIATILCNALTGALSTVLKDGCTCRARFRLFTYLANLRLSECELKTRLCLDGKPEETSAAVCGNPEISTDLYIRNRASKIGIGLTNITGFEKIIPVIPDNPFLSSTVLLTGLFFDVTLKTGLDLANIANSINITGCNFYVGANKEQKCTSCTACNAGKGVSFNCSNINFLEAKFVNTTIFVKLPVPTTCLAIPGLTA